LPSLLAEHVTLIKPNTRAADDPRAKRYQQQVELIHFSCCQYRGKLPGITGRSAKFKSRSTHQTVVRDKKITTWRWRVIREYPQNADVNQHHQRTSDSVFARPKPASLPLGNAAAMSNSRGAVASILHNSTTTKSANWIALAKTDTAKIIQARQSLAARYGRGKVVISTFSAKRTRQFILIPIGQSLGQCWWQTTSAPDLRS
jgi:hypothetical protein